MIYLFVVFYILAGMSYLKGLLSMESVSSELNTLSEKVGLEAKNIDTPLQDSKLLCLLAVVFWPLLALIGFVGS